MGGNAAGPVEPEDHDFALWEKRIDALYNIAAAKGIFTVDGLRRALEDMGEEAFETMSYYERWVAAVNQIFSKRASIPWKNWVPRWRPSPSAAAPRRGRKWLTASGSKP